MQWTNIPAQEKTQKARKAAPDLSCYLDAGNHTTSSIPVFGGALQASELCKQGACFPNNDPLMCLLKNKRPDTM